MKHFLIIATLAFSSCDERNSQSTDSGSHSVESNAPTRAETTAELPKAFEKLVTSIINSMPEERKAEIRDAPLAEMMVDHFGMGLALRNGELSQANSDVRRYLIRQGIYHRDDLSSIVLLTVNRRIRDEPIDLPGQILKCRDYWAKLDTVAPTDLDCPTCGQELDPYYLGSGVPAHPTREYFRGYCPEGHDYVYYHSDGWIAAEDFQTGEQGEDPNRDGAPGD